jgi:hypothetical protein
MVCLIEWVLRKRLRFGEDTTHDFYAMTGLGGHVCESSRHGTRADDADRAHLQSPLWQGAEQLDELLGNRGRCGNHPDLFTCKKQVICRNFTC